MPKTEIETYDQLVQLYTKLYIIAHDSEPGFVPFTIGLTKENLVLMIAQCRQLIRLERKITAQPGEDIDGGD